MTDPRRAVPRTDAVLADPPAGRRRAPAGPRPRSRPRSPPRRSASRDGELAPGRGRRRRCSPRCRPRASSLRPVLNATGVVLHTNLGRAPLSRGRGARRWSRPAGTTDVELDLATGRAGPARPGRAGRAARGACPAAEAVHRGQQRRRRAGAGRDRARPRAARSWSAAASWSRSATGSGCPTCWRRTGARLREVGTTNRTTLADYADAVGPDTGCVLKVHPSNFVVRGFTARRRGRRAGPALPGRRPVVVDIGSGPAAPAPAAARRAGRRDHPARRRRRWSPRSGDKLLGGPQAGLLLGPARRGRAAAPAPAGPGAAGGQADPGRAGGDRCAARVPPVRRRCDADPAALRARARAVAAALRDGRRRRPSVVARPRRVGGGGAPGVELPAWAVALPSRFAAPLRPGDPPVVGRVERRPLPARPALRRRRPTTTALRRAAVRGTVAAADARGRHRRPRRPRQVHPGPGADRDGAGPLGGGAPPRADHRPRLRLDDAAVGRRRRLRRRARARAVRRQHARRGRARCRPRCSWSPPTRAGSAQTAEHLAALDALGVRHGLLVVTKADLADPGAGARRRPRAARRRPRWARLPAVAVSAAHRRRAARAARPRWSRCWPGCRAPDAGRAGAAVGRPGVHHPRRRHGGHRHPGRRHRAAGDQLELARPRRCACAACSRWARPSSRRRPPPGWR